MSYKRTLNFKDSDKPVIMVIDEYVKISGDSFSNCVLFALHLLIQNKTKEVPCIINKCINLSLKKLGSDKFVKRVESKESVHRAGDNRDK